MPVPTLTEFKSSRRFTNDLRSVINDISDFPNPVSGYYYDWPRGAWIEINYSPTVTYFCGDLVGGFNDLNKAELALYKFLSTEHVDN